MALYAIVHYLLNLCLADIILCLSFLVTVTTPLESLSITNQPDISNKTIEGNNTTNNVTMLTTANGMYVNVMNSNTRTRV